MNQIILSTTAGVAFALVGGITVWLMFQATARMKQKGSNARLIAAHRIGGYVFIALFGVMTWYMVQRFADMPDDSSATRPLVHMILAVVLMPLLFVKVLIARYYKTAFYSALLPLGLIIYSIGFVLVAITAGPYILRRATVESIPLESVQMGTQQIDVEAAQLLAQDRCAKCHDLDRVFGARKDAKGWLDTVNRMRSYPGANISSDDGKTLVAYLVSRVGIDETSPKGEETVGKTLVDTRCNKCHDLQQVYRAQKTPDEWKSTVDRMVGYAPEGHFKPGETDQILAFLSSTRTPEAKQQSSKPVAAAAAVEPTAKPSTPEPQTRSSTAFYVYAAVVLALVGGLVIRRPGGGGPGPATPRSPDGQGGGSSSSGPRGNPGHVLELVRTEQRTHDSKTLRFLVPPDKGFSFKPGQFLTFQWEIDGERVVRSYSISSSPSQRGFVEITAKRVPDGRVSVFLNDRAAPGMRVTAKGPAGKFTFDEAAHRSIVLIAGGSGITPVMSILRWIDDRCLAVTAKLVYAVRTPDDVIFADELQAIASRMPGVSLAVVPSHAGADWKGPTGRIDRRLFDAEIGETEGKTFFLCGPASFMEVARELLVAMGVDEAKILQEKFGGPKASAGSAPDTGAIDGRVTFAKSGVAADAPLGSSILEVAEMHGVSIPFSCRQGQCGTCATRLVDGEVAMEAEDGLGEDDRAEGRVLLCVGHARGDIVLDA